MFAPYIYKTWEFVPWAINFCVRVFLFLFFLNTAFAIVSPVELYQDMREIKKGSRAVNISWGV